MQNPFKFLFSRQPVYLVYHVTRACNMACSHCFQYESSGPPSKELTLEEIEMITTSMGHIKYLTLAGGEPFLRDDLADIVECFYRNNDLHVLNVVTNGWFSKKTVRFVEQVIERCPGMHMSIGVSVDGPETIHDRLRGHEGAYAKALQTIHALKTVCKKNKDVSKRLTVAGCGTYCNMNKERITETADFFMKTLATPYYAGLIRGKAMRDKTLLNIDIDHYMAVIHQMNYSSNLELASNYPFRHIRIAVDQVVTDVIYTSCKHNRMTASCKAGRKGFVLRANGDVLLCEVLNECLGNVRQANYSPARILNSPMSKKKISMLKTNACHCTWECFQRLNVIFSPSLYLLILTKMMRSIILSEKNNENIKIDSKI